MADLSWASPPDSGIHVEVVLSFGKKMVTLFQGFRMKGVFMLSCLGETSYII